MTIEDAIKHCRDTALSNAGNAIAYLKGGQKMLAESCEKCAAEHEQLAKWLEELKQRRKAEPVRHGRWIPTEYDSYADGAPVWDKWECSECGHEHSGEEDTLTAFCPDCGLKMDGIDVITDCDTLSDTDCGKWALSTYLGYVRCSSCGLGVTKDEAGSKCPYCGAKMDGEEAKENATD